MKYLILAALTIGLVACGDDTDKKAASNNVTSNNTTSNNTTSNNTTSNNTTANNTTANNTTSNNTTSNNTTSNNTVAAFDLGDDTAAISTLVAADVCSKGEAYFAGVVSEDETKKLGCVFDGYFTAAYGEPAPATDSELQAACQTRYDECLTEPVDNTNNTTDECTFVTDGCDAPIALLEACVEGQAAAIKAAAAVTCSDLGLETDPLSSLTDPLECDQLAEQCPALFGEEG